MDFFSFWSALNMWNKVGLAFVAAVIAILILLMLT